MKFQILAKLLLVIISTQMAFPTYASEIHTLTHAEIHQIENPESAAVLDKGSQM